MYKIFKYQENNRLLECTEVGTYYNVNKVVEELRIQYVRNGLEPHNYTVAYWPEEDFESTQDYETPADKWLDSRKANFMNLINRKEYENHS